MIPEQGQDEIFVARVMAQVARRRRQRAAIGTALSAAAVAGIFFTVPHVMASTEVVASLPALATESLGGVLSSPIGLIASLPIGLLVLALSSLRAGDQ